MRRKDGWRRLSLNTTVWGSGASMPSTLAYQSLRALSLNLAGASGASRTTSDRERRLEALDLEYHRVGIGRLDALHVGIPVLARAQSQLGRRVRCLANHVEGVLDVARGEGTAVVPLHVLLQEEDE